MIRKDNISIEEFIRQMNSRYFIERLSLFIWGLLLYASSFSVFFAQYNIVTGGTMGLSLLVKSLFNINNSIFVFLFSLVVLVIGYFTLGKINTIKTFFGVLLLPIFMEFTSIFPKIFNFEISSMFLIVFFWRNSNGAW